MSRPVLLLLAAVAVLGALAWWSGRDGTAAPPAPPSPPPAASPSTGPAGFVGSDTCKECHEERHETWLDTAHAYALRAPTPDVVAGRFDGTPIEAEFFTATPYARDGEYFIRVEGKDGRPAGDHRITRVVGRTFEQAYLYTDPNGAWRVLPLSWSLERGTWDLTHEVLEDIAGHVGAVSNRTDTRATVFNHGCGQCHATDYDVGFDVDKGTYHSTFLEGAVACESCHGPGSVHTAFHRAEGGAGGGEDAARLLHPRRDLDAREQLDSCGRCHYLHTWRYAIDADPRRSHHDIAMSINRDRPAFFADGRLDGLNYHGSTQRQSACYLKGDMSCLSCHRMHGGEKWAMKWKGDSDAQCTQCHDEPKWAAREHTHHEDVRCVDCHMPKLLRPDRILHFLRDHSIRSPEPALTEKFGAKQSPNACGVCHTDQTASWAREWKEKWWGAAPERYVRNVQLIVDLRGDRDVATARLAEVVADGESRHFFRMTALHELGKRLFDGEAARAAVLAVLTAPDADPEMLQTACASWGVRPHPDGAGALLALAGHAVRTVRVEAAYAAARCGWRGTAPEVERAYADALDMFVRQKPFPDMQIRVAMLADALGRDEEANEHFRVLLQIANWRGGWPGEAIDLLHRRARALTEAGEHARALELYGQVRAMRPDPVPDRLFLDSADSLTALGQSGAVNWTQIVEKRTPETFAHRLASARLLAARGAVDEARRRLEALHDELQPDPARGNDLRRLRWALANLE